MGKDKTEKMRVIMLLAGEEAKRLKNAKISPEHLFLGIMRFEQVLGINILIALGVDLDEVKN